MAVVVNGASVEETGGYKIAQCDPHTSRGREWARKIADLINRDSGSQPKAENGEAG